MINKIALIGFLGSDPEIRQIENETSVGRFSLATSETFKDATGEPKTETQWHNIVVWRQQAELAERLLKKGVLVYVEGKISYRKYADKNGAEKMATDITCSNFRILEKKDKNGGDAVEPTSYENDEKPSTQQKEDSFSFLFGEGDTFEVTEGNEKGKIVSIKEKKDGNVTFLLGRDEKTVTLEVFEKLSQKMKPYKAENLNSNNDETDLPF